MCRHNCGRGARAPEARAAAGTWRCCASRCCRPRLCGSCWPPGWRPRPKLPALPGRLCPCRMVSLQRGCTQSVGAGPPSVCICSTARDLTPPQRMASASPARMRFCCQPTRSGPGLSRPRWRLAMLCRKRNFLGRRIHRRRCDRIRHGYARPPALPFEQPCRSCPPAAGRASTAAAGMSPPAARPTPSGNPHAWGARPHAPPASRPGCRGGPSRRSLPLRSNP
mmetsp:Transcript_2984/g.8746  ORF Transcript_2984/g.8746 Transcript_2984/m.8746 type:complete len:223 (+) Transcript_2984:1347-2015(+)